MSDFFIVSSRKFFRYSSLTKAEQARNRLANERPDNKYRVYRCKTHLHGAKHFSTMVRLMQEIRDHGLHEGTFDRLNDLLAKVAERDQQAADAAAAAATQTEHESEAGE